MTVKRGEIYWVEFDPVKGSEQGGLRPALVVQNDVGNRYSPTTIVVAITRTIPPRPYPFTVVIEPEESGLSERSVINCSQMAIIHQAGPASRFRPPCGKSDVQPIGHLDVEKLAQVDQALKFNLALD
jgi:mRNA interferase MazF